MKYLFIILAIVAASITLSRLLLISPEKMVPDDIAITINGHNIAEKTVVREETRFGYHADEQSERYDSIITKELLLQEAKKQAIDKEESFREALKVYYENSLIKILLERKNGQITVTVSAADIDNYISFLGTVVSFTRLDIIPSSEIEAKSAKGKTHSALFDDLAAPVKLLLSSLKPNQFGIKFDTGNEKYAVRLDSISSPSKSSPPNIDRRKITEMIEDYKREQKINSWLTELKQDANITIHKQEQVQ